jgi:thiamine biosynthesis lipoprotein
MSVSGSGSNLAAVIPWLAMLATALIGEGGGEDPHASAARGQGEPSAILVQTQWIMGTSLRIAVVDDSPRSAGILQELFDEARRWNDLLSNYAPETPLSRINRRAGEEVGIPCELQTYLERMIRDVKRTDGAFDPTVGARLAPAWGTDLENQGAHGDSPVGAHLLRLRRDDLGCWARLPAPGMALDPGADGKGVALDQLRRILDVRKIEHALIDFGGSSLLAIGRPPDAPAWVVDLPALGGGTLGRLRLVDRALSVSSSFKLDRAPADSGSATVPRVPHIMDPRTGEWIDQERIAVVLSPSATDAEVLSTALIVEGAHGMRWLERFEAAEALLLEGGRAPVMSSGLSEWLDLRSALD